MRRTGFLSLSILTLLLAHSALSQNAPTDSFTVQQAVQRVLERHPAVSQALETVQASVARVDQDRSPYYPKADAEIGYTRLGPIAKLDVPILGSFKLFPENNYDGHLSVEQTVFDFGKTRASIDLGETNLQSARDKVESVKTGLAFQTIETFYTILYLQQSIQVQDEQINALNQHLLTTQKKVQSGSATDFDVLTTEVRVSAAETQKIDVENELRKQEVAFRRLLDFPPTSPVHLHGDFSLPPIPLKADSLMAVAMQRRIEVRLSHDGEKSAEMQLQNVSLRDMPSLKVNLAYGLKNGYIPNLDVLRGNWVAAVGVQVPIFNGFKTHSQEQESEANLRAARAHTTDVERAVTSEVLQAVSDVRASLDKIQTSELQVRQAKQAIDMATVRYETGVVTNLDLIDAQTALAQAEFFHLQALYHYVLSRYSLDKSIGVILQ
jgi:outer membrane protein